jgi:3-hydroxymyristoyl/3-hydroxydecanoyl-(acyl carrier protein) dehydratase
VDHETLLRQFRKKPLFTLDTARDTAPVIAPVVPPAIAPTRFTPLAWGRDDIKRILPHREPFLLVDRLTGISFDDQGIAGARFISPDDPILAGHFPDFPVYPGSLEVEMIGQLGLCLHYFLQSRSTSVPDEVRALQVRATRILGACYLEPVLPGREIVLFAKKLEADEYLATMIGQVIADGKIACVAVGEVCFV